MPIKGAIRFEYVWTKQVLLVNFKFILGNQKIILKSENSATAHTPKLIEEKRQRRAFSSTQICKRVCCPP